MCCRDNVPQALRKWERSDVNNSISAADQINQNRVAVRKMNASYENMALQIMQTTE